MCARVVRDCISNTTERERERGIFHLSAHIKEERLIETYTLERMLNKHNNQIQSVYTEIITAAAAVATTTTKRVSKLIYMQRLR